MTPPKTPRKRSRAGCVQCKEKKKKCTEARPKCERCVERDLSCDYEPIKPRKPRRVLPSGAVQGSLSLRMRPHSPSRELASLQQPHLQPRPLDTRFIGTATVAELPTAVGDGWNFHPPLSPSFVTEGFGVDDEGWVPEPSLSTDVIATDEDDGWTLQQPLDISLPYETVLQSPDPLEHTLSNDAVATASHPLVETAARNIETVVSRARATDEIEEVERERRGNMFAGPTALQSTNRYPSQVTLQFSNGPRGFCPPVFVEFSTRRSRRQLVDHFCNVLSHLIVLKEDKGNPFRELVLPLSITSPPVLNAVFALSSAHLEFRGYEGQEKSVDFHSQALQSLSQLINENKTENVEEALGTIILLIYYEALVRPGNSTIVTSHLQGAMSMMQLQPDLSTPTRRFLERAFHFFDVITALSLGMSPVSDNPTCLGVSSLLPPDSSPDTPTSPHGSIDTLFGMATELWPTIHRLSNLLKLRNDVRAAEARGKLALATVLRTELRRSAMAIETALMAWTPGIPLNATHPTTPFVASGSPSTTATDITVPHTTHADGARLQGAISNAEAYRHAALVYLYRSIQGCARRAAKVQQHTKNALHACLNVVRSAGPMGTLLWPLFVASCEALDPDDRAVAHLAYSGIKSRQGMVNIARASDFIEEVWHRVDALPPDAVQDVDWREVAREKDINIIFG